MCVCVCVYVWSEWSAVLSPKIITIDENYCLKMANFVIQITENNVLGTPN